jgi:hypothetical protein
MDRTVGVDNVAGQDNRNRKAFCRSGKTGETEQTDRNWTE